MLPIYSVLVRNKNLTNEEILRLRPKKVRAYDIENYKFSDDSTRNMSDFIILYKRGTWELTEISRNLQIPMWKIEEFLQYYVTTGKGRVMMMEVTFKRYEDNESVEVIANRMGLSIDEVFDYLSVAILQSIIIVPIGIYTNICNMYINLHMSTSSIASSLGCPYNWVVYTLIDWRLPDRLNKNKMKGEE